MLKRKRHESEELELTTLLNILVVLVSFLLLSAVFSKVTIQELNMPPQGSGPAEAGKELAPVVIEVMVRKDGLEIGNGKEVTDRLPKLGDRYDTAGLSQKLKLLKDQYPGKRDAILLVEPDIGYAAMIAVMDALKFVEIRGPREGSQRLRITLFPNVTVGDAP
ncbi:biopolymer transporter ExbD [Methylibium rhizosphaerae]|jgi:biopolymer transport protein ExbD|uniref:biopolymer transporter ExbD n=1 Tax=Methylibium rhizosphaerae TaxID=2570323 RepID=UPI00112792E6|nr:biopolymer transporter ExbD [Methylibium rhizosphaerae]